MSKLINLPFCSSVSQFESLFEQLLALDLPESTRKYYEDKYEQRDRWSMAFKKTLPCLKINTTSRIEGLNAIIKSEIASSSQLTELFYRLLSIHDHILAKSYSDSDILSDSAISVLENCRALKKIKGKATDFLYKQMALSCSNALRLDVSLYGGVYSIKEDGVTLRQIDKTTLNCECKYFVTMGIPCEHLAAISGRYENICLISKIRSRWVCDTSTNIENSSLLKQFIKDFLQKNTTGKLNSRC